MSIQLDGRFVALAEVAKGEGLALLAVAGRVAGGVCRALHGTQRRAVPALRHAAAERLALAVAGLGGRLVGYPGARQLGQALAWRQIPHRGRGGGFILGGVLALASPPHERERGEDDEQASDARADADAGLAACREPGGSDLRGGGGGSGSGSRGEVGVLPADGHAATIVEDVPGGLLSTGLGDGLGNEGRAGLGLGPGKGLLAAIDAESTIAGCMSRCIYRRMVRS